MPKSATTADSFPSRVSAEPNKDFFVHMLTRDIELGDAILDLLDNCVDGIVRNLGSAAGKGEKPYAKYYARITLKPNSFRVEDNCGGIPLDLAKTKAFHMGTPPGHKSQSATVGMYGIGMKRAIFKIGEQCEVRSRNGSDAFQVSISKRWLKTPNDWKLPITRLPTSQMPVQGTTIEVNELRPEIARRFDESKDAFVSDFVTFVSQHYSLILEKGFKVSINGTRVEPASFQLLSSDGIRLKSDEAALAPYIVEATIQGVSVTIAVGFYRKMPDEAEIEEEQEGKASKSDAGWTIVCNDRIVVYRDKTRLTGWGEAGVPNYHTQFIAVCGIVVLHSTDLWKLPLTTTKRGIDPSSEVYSVVKDYMREGMKYFTRFTNRWKKSPQERDQLYRSAKLMDLESLLKAIPPSMKAHLRASAKGVSSGRRFAPNLPQPKSAAPDVRISFVRPKTEVRVLATRMFGDPDAAPSDVGAKCFDDALAKVPK